MAGRNGNHEGTIVESGGRIRVALMINGKRVWRSAKTEKEAKQIRKDLRRAAEDGRLRVDSQQKVSTFLHSWLTDHVKATLRPRTYESYALNVARLGPHIGKVKLTDLRPAHLQRAYAALQEGGLSPRSIQQAHTVLHTALQVALRQDLIRRNPATLVSPPRPRPTEMVTLTEDDVRTLIAGTSNDRLHALWVILVTTGMRVGEALGLQWRDIDLDHGKATIRRQVQRQRGVGLVLCEPKTRASRRTVDLASKSAEVLRRHRAQQRAESLAMGRVWAEDQQVFCNTTGGYMDAGNVREALQRRTKLLNLPPIRVHDLRHTFATLQLKEREHPKVVQEMLGHSTIAITLDTYSHVTPGMSSEAAERMNKLFS